MNWQVVPYKAPAASLEEAVGSSVSVFLSDVETDPWPPANITALAARCCYFLSPPPLPPSSLPPTKKATSAAHSIDSHAASKSTAVIGSCQNVDIVRMWLLRS